MLKIEIIKIVKAKHVIPSHGGPDKTVPMISLTNELGYKRGKNVHIMADGGILKL